MQAVLPPVRLEGAEVLGGGLLRAHPIAIADGLIVHEAHRGVDLTGYVLLPGAVDLGGGNLPVTNPEGAVRLLAEEAARSGTTTLWAGLNWPEETAHLDASRAVLAAFTALQPRLSIEVGLRIEVSTHAFETISPLLDCLSTLERVLVVLRHPSEEVRGVLEAEVGGAGPVARHLCHMASVFDGLKLCYGTLADRDGEVRERFSMIGARMAFRPAARGAAASARAMNEPVILGAADVLGVDGIGRNIAAVLLSEGLCDAVGAFGGADTPRRLVRELVEANRLSIGHAWALISAAPAGILRLADRGGLVEGTRADLAILRPKTLEVAGTICRGVLVHADDELGSRFETVLEGGQLAAE